MLSPLSRLLHLRGQLHRGRFVPVIFRQFMRADFFDLWGRNPVPLQPWKTVSVIVAGILKGGPHEKGISNSGNRCHGGRNDDVRTG
jgi:hypothetical protein